MVKAHPVAGKQRSVNICNAFLEGMGNDRYKEEGAVFFGVNETNVGHWDSVRRRGTPYYYIDNSYFDKTRGTHYRVSKNSIQYKGPLGSTGERVKAIGLAPLQPWQSISAPGAVMLVEQSSTFMRCVVRYVGSWLEDNIRIAHNTWPRKEMIVRRWSPNKLDIQQTLQHDLDNTAVLVTHSSAAAISSMIRGIQTITSSMSALADHPMSYDPAIDSREKLLATLADNQWTLDEIKEGRAWEWLKNR